MPQAQTSNPWTWNQKGPEQYNVDAARRQAQLGVAGANGRSAADTAELQYLKGLQSQGQPQGGAVQPYSGSQMMTDPLTGRRRNMAYNEYAGLDPSRNAAYAGQMQNTLQMLPQLQQAIMSVPSQPGEPSPQDRWNTMLRQLLSGGTLAGAMTSGNAWGGM